MMHKLVPAAVLAAAVPVFAQARLDADLLFPTDLIAPAGYTDSQCALRGVVSAGLYAQLSPTHQQMIVRFANDRAKPGAPAAHELPSACWAAPVPDATMALWNSFMQGPLQFNPFTRWSTTATDGGGLNTGDPTTLTYSFVPDGTFIDSGVGEPVGNSSLFATFNGAFPSQTTWQDRFHAAFQRWSELTGITYVYEPNDDGAAIGTVSGQLGVRGDVRIGCKLIDGGSGILAYNAYPNDGDMVLDQGDISLFDNTNNNYRFLFNVVAHEHGHGIGIRHVCPINQTKLMEPFASTAFNGPQFDDILTGQRLYGDASEPNDTPFASTYLGTLGNGIDITTLQSIDGSGDSDYFRFTISVPKKLEVDVIPSGAPYLEGDQLGSGACEPGVTFDPRALRDLSFHVIDSNGITVLQTTNGAPAGGTESSSPIVLPNAGDYYVRVFGGPTDNAQIYELALTISDAPPFELEIVGGPPTVVASDLPTAVTVRVVPGTSNVSPTSGLLFSTVNGGGAQFVGLESLGNDEYRGLLPAAQCYDTIRWYVAFQPLAGGSFEYLPLGGPVLQFETEVLNLPLVSVFADDFETAQGWSVVDDANLTDGTWNRGVPVGGGDRGDPATAAGGSGQCYLTDNVDGNSDVDGGETALLSPLINLSQYPDAKISYSYWYTNNNGSNPGQDVWLAQISADGGANWVTVQSTSASTAVWTDVSFQVSQYVPTTPFVRMRFVASDPAPGAVVEAGLDDFRVDVCAPSPVELLPGACGGPFAASTIGVDQSPVAGTTFQIECSAAALVTGPVFQGFVLGLGQIGATLPSCGCTVHPTLDALELGLGNWTAPGLQTWSLPFAAPPGITGAQFYVQGLVAGSLSNTCTETGLFVNVTDALLVTVQ